MKKQVKKLALKKNVVSNLNENKLFGGKEKGSLQYSNCWDCDAAIVPSKVAYNIDGIFITGVC